MSFSLDLTCLVGDVNIRESLNALLERTRALNIRQLRTEIYTHPQHDPGCYRRSVEFLSSFQRRTEYALVVFDRQGCGQEAFTRDELELDLERRLAAAGWQNRVAVIAIDPELENWVWSDSPHVATTLGWPGKEAELRELLERRGFWTRSQSKPSQPKEATEAALALADIARTSSVYRSLARQVSFRRCSDPAFQKLLRTLRQWFGAAEGA